MHDYAPREAYSEHALLLPYQQRWVLDTSGFRVCEKSRRVGMTWATAAYAVWLAAQGKCDVWYILYNEDGAKEFILDCVKTAQALNLFAGAYETVVLPEDEVGRLEGVKAFQITCPSGKRISALTSAPRNLRGKQGLVVIDEAAFHDDLPGLLKAAAAFRLWGGQVWVMSTHDGIENPFNRLVEDIRAGKVPYSLHRVTFRSALADGLYRRISLIQGREWSPEAERRWEAEIRAEMGDNADEELDCVPSRGGVAYFNRDVIESRMAMDRPVLRLYLPREFTARPEQQREQHVRDWLEAEVGPRIDKLARDRTHFLGVDFGRTSDLSVLMPGALLGDLTRDVPFIIELSNVPFEQQRQVAFYVLDRLPRFLRAHFDATGNGAYLAEVCAQRYGQQRVVEVKISERWHLESWPPLRAAFEEGKIRLPSDEEVRADFMAVKRTQGIPKLPNAVLVKSEGATIRRHGDVAVACAMLYSATRELEGALIRGEQWKRAASEGPWSAS
jgi:phage FluMu gp28-like protein